MKKLSSSVIIFSVFLIPVLATSITIASPTPNVTTVFDIFDSFRKFAYLFLAPIAIAIILFGAFNFLTAAGDIMKITKAKQILFYGAIGIAVVILAVAIPSILMNILGVESPIAKISPTPTPIPKTCDQLGGTCCSSGVCTIGRISGASDCIDCCHNDANCEEEEVPEDYPEDPDAALAQFLSDCDKISDPIMKALCERKKLIDSL